MKHTRFIPKKSPTGKWVINVPGQYTASGKRERRYFDTKEKALEYAGPLKEQKEKLGHNAQSISPAIAENTVVALKLLEPLGISLLEAVQKFVQLETANRSSNTIEEAIKAFMVSKTWSKEQTAAYKLRGEKLVEAFPTRIIATITGEELRQHIENTTNGNAAFNLAVRHHKAIWNWCAKPPRTWCNAAVLDHLEAKETVSGEIEVFTYEQALKIMRVAEKYLPETIPAFAIALFTGMRQAEIERLRPVDINDKGITVPAKSAKTKRRRFIEMPEPLLAWLKAYPIKATVIPPDWKRKNVAVKRLAGYKVWSDLVPRLDKTLTPEPPDDLPPWKDNAFRHTAASIAVATGKNIDSLLFEMGHSGGVALLKRHYLGVMPKEEAEKILSIRPQ